MKEMTGPHEFESGQRENIYGQDPIFPKFSNQIRHNICLLQPAQIVSCHLTVTQRVHLRVHEMAGDSSKSATKPNEVPYELPWYVYNLITSEFRLIYLRVEKYRPHVLDDIVGNADTIDRLKVIARDGNCPHIIISVRI